MNGKMDLSQAEAVADIIASTTQICTQSCNKSDAWWIFSRDWKAQVGAS